MLHIKKVCPYYTIVEDGQISTKNKENIILSPAGLRYFADYYRRKYHITILIEEAPIELASLPERINCIISVCLDKNLSMAGFIFISKQDPEDAFGHALPMVWERDNHQMHLFFLDTMQWLGEADENKNDFLEIKKCRENIRMQTPGVKLWSMMGQRQVDYSSCYTDALVILRDALRATSFKRIIEKNTQNVMENDITLFLLPEMLLKTTQRLTLLEKQALDMDAMVHLHRNKNTEKKPVGTHTPVSLRQWRDRYSVSAILRPMAGNKNAPKKLFGTFTLFKGKKYQEKLDTLVNHSPPDRSV